MLFPPEIINDTTESHFVSHSTKSRIIYLTVIIFIAAVIVSLPFISVEISTQARGIVRTPLENNQLQTVVYGEVVNVFIEENSEVKKGDTLIVLNSDNIQEQIRRKQDKILEDSSFIFDVGSLLLNDIESLRTPKYTTEYNYFKSALNEQQTKINFLQKEYQLAKILYEKNVTPKQEYLQQKNNYENALSQRENLKKQFYNRWQAEKTDFELEIKELYSSIKQLEEEKTKYVIKAPSSGSIIQFSGIKEGNFISPNQTIAYISTNDSLLVECYISPIDIGFIKQGQKVSFQLDAFNYNQWGLAHGKVKEISKDIILINDQPVFRVRCSLDESFLKLKNGYEGNLKKGMTLTGRFYLTDRTLWELLFDKVDDWVNPKLKNS